MTVELVTLVLALVAMALIFVPTLITGSSPVPTSRRVRDAIMGLLPDRLPGPTAGTIYELGCGWGGMAFALARRYPDHSVIGYEISPVPWCVARLRLLVRPQKNLRIEWGDYHKRNIADGVLVLCYLLPEPMQRLKAKLAAELAPGALVVSNTFAFRGWQPLDDKLAGDIYKSHVFLYEIGTTGAS